MDYVLDDDNEDVSSPDDSIIFTQSKFFKNRLEKTCKIYIYIYNNGISFL